jgi:hypothetical protein
MIPSRRDRLFLQAQKHGQELSESGFSAYQEIPGSDVKHDLSAQKTVDYHDRFFNALSEHLDAVDNDLIPFSQGAKEILKRLPVPQRPVGLFEFDHFALQNELLLFGVLYDRSPLCQQGFFIAQLPDKCIYHVNPFTLSEIVAIQ